MDEILRISDEVTIMRDGQYIGTWAAKDLDIDTIITKMVGRELTNLYPERHNVPGDVVFEVDLLKSQEINLDYILELIYEKNKNTKIKYID